MTDSNRIARARAFRAALKGITQYIPDEKALEIPALFDKWQPDEGYKSGDIRIDPTDGLLYRCIAANPVSANPTWRPGLTPALWVRIQFEQPGQVLPWIAGEAVAAGDKRTYGGKTYECVQGHTTQAGWEPPNVAALWKVA